jgi:integrase
MPRFKDRQYLTKRGEIWYAQMPVPKQAQHGLGRKTLEKSLRTSDIVIAKERLWSVITDFQERIRSADLPPEPFDANAFLKLATELRAATEAGTLKPKVAEIDLEGALAALLARRAKETSVDDEGRPELPASELATIRKANAIFDGNARGLLELLTDRWLKHEESSSIRRATLGDKRRHIDRFLKWAGNDTDAASITKARATEYVEEVLLPWDVTPDTKRFALNTVRQFYDWLEVRDIVKANPFDKVGRLIRDAARGDHEEDGRRSWQPEEVLKVLRYIPQDDPMWPLVILMAYTGARREELCSMRVANVTESAMFNPRGKSPSARRLIPIHPVIGPLVKRLTEISTDDFLIPGLLTTGKDNKRGILIGKRLATTIRDAGIKDESLVAHGFRHSVETQLEAAGVSLRMRQQILGHKSKTITEAHYTDPASIERKAEAIKVVSYGKDVTALIRSASKKLKLTRVEKPRK